MASSRFHKAMQRRAERAPLTAHGHINLVPLVDILTSIVFFSLLTYTGAAMSSLLAFDLALPPVVVTADKSTANAGQKDTTTFLLAVKMYDGNLRIEHTGSGTPFVKEIAGLTGPALDTLQTVLASVKTQYPDNNDVMVVPDDAVQYDDLVHVMERIKAARFGGISLVNRERATQVAATAGRM